MEQLNIFEQLFTKEILLAITILCNFIINIEIKTAYITKTLEPLTIV